ncbi:putative zinc finger protein [Sugiyamaella lignohabitans]|uniref:Putative zinc finger protein n=1 Tax=Sugiyamaella lignohabitans TaxID=796027 RepID=A0A167CIT9_9ASCO|nr:putative zinc finger protein [Sugiyamaella lignohabitans]ANB11754.1 putative zinc finger protein [Sugiyamaella lignohabitans]
MAYVQQKAIQHAPHHHHNHHHEDAKYLSSSMPTSLGLNGYQPRHQRQNSNSAANGSSASSSSTGVPSGISPSPTSSPSPTIPSQQPPSQQQSSAANAALPSVPYYKLAVHNSSSQQIPNSPQSNPHQSGLGAAGSPQNFPTLSRKFVARRISEGETGRLKEELKCQACGKGYKHVSSLAKHLWEHTPEWNVTSKLLISKHQQVQLLEAASILVSMNEEDEEEEDQGHVPTFDFSRGSYLGKSTNSYFTHPSPPPGSNGSGSKVAAANGFANGFANGINGVNGVNGVNSVNGVTGVNGATNGYYTSSGTALTPPPTSGSNSSSGTPTLEPTSSSNAVPGAESNGANYNSDSSPSPSASGNNNAAVPVPSIPISSSTRAISKHTSTAAASSLHYARRSSIVSAAYPPSSARRGSIPNVSFTPSSPGVPSSLTQRASAASLSKSPIVTDSLFNSDYSHSHKLNDEYEMLATPYRSRRLSHMRRSRGDIFNDNPSPPEDHDDDKAHSHSNGDESNSGVFGDMDD